MATLPAFALAADITQLLRKMRALQEGLRRT